LAFLFVDSNSGRDPRWNIGKIVLSANGAHLYQPGATPQENGSDSHRRAIGPSHPSLWKTEMNRTFGVCGGWVWAFSCGVAAGWYGCAPLALKTIRIWLIRKKCSFPSRKIAWIANPKEIRVRKVA
jgi:hypothetical protein